MSERTKTTLRDRLATALMVIALIALLLGGFKVISGGLAYIIILISSAPPIALYSFRRNLAVKQEKIGWLGIICIVLGGVFFLVGFYFLLVVQNTRLSYLFGAIGMAFFLIFGLQKVRESTGLMRLLYISSIALFVGLIINGVVQFLADDTLIRMLGTTAMIVGGFIFVAGIQAMQKDLDNAQPEQDKVGG